MVDDLNYVIPNSGVDWRAEKLQINMLPWNFSHAILRSSGRNELMLPNGQDVTAIIGEKSALSLNWDSTNIQEAGLTLDQGDIITAQGDYEIENLKASLVEAGAGTPGKRILIDWDRIALADQLIAGTELQMLGNTLQPSRLRVHAQGFGIFGEAEDRKIEIAQILFNWGELKLGTKGNLKIGQDGFPDGSIQIRLDEADTLLQSMKENGNFSSQQIGAVNTIALATKNADFLTIPIRDGAVSYPGLSAQVFPQFAPEISDDDSPE